LRKPRATYRVLLIVVFLAALIGASVAYDEWDTNSGASGSSSSGVAQANALSAGGSAQPSSSVDDVPTPPPSRALPRATTAARPVIRTVSPHAGVDAGGNEVTIKGENLEVAQVLFDSSVARVVSQAPDAVTVVAPPREDMARVSIVVTNRDGSYAVASGAYRYER
jgi:hypothetical protein